MLYQYTNKEKDHCEQAFRTGNFTDIRSLPNALEPFCVEQQLKEKVADTHLIASIQSLNNKVQREHLKSGGGYFGKFEWMPDEYNNERDLHFQDVKSRDSKIRTMHGSYFNPSQVKPTLKYEYPFLGRNEVHTYTFLSANDPYEATINERMRARWIAESKILYGDFVPSGP